MRSLARPKGFTIIEILIALLILSVSLLAVAGLMLMTAKNNSFGGRLTEAVTLAQERLEQLKVTPFAAVSSGSCSRTGTTGINYTQRWTVATNGDGNLKTLTLTITWSDDGNRSITLLTSLLDRL